MAILTLTTASPLTPDEQANLLTVLNTFLTDVSPMRSGILDDLVNECDCDDCTCNDCNCNDLPYQYKFNVSDEITETHGDFISQGLGLMYEDDFELAATWSGDVDDDVEIDADALAYIQEGAARFMHNRWVENKVQEGWRWGQRYNINERTDPALKDFDNVHTGFRKQLEMTPKQAVDFLRNHPHLFA